MACAPSKWAGVLGAAVALGCMPPSFAPDRHAKDLKQGGAGLLSTGSRCEAVRPPTKPDLFGWDAGSRGELASIARQGVVVVQYQTRGCDVQLSVLNNCTVRAASYQFSPYTESQTRIATDEASLYANFPLAFGALRTRLAGGRGLRADYRLAGIDAVPLGTRVASTDLVGDCSGATHFVRAVHRGVFALAAGDVVSLSADASLLGGNVARSLQIFDSAGSPDRCSMGATRADGCDVPLRIELLPLATSGGAAVTGAVGIAPVAASATPADGVGTSDAGTPAEAPSAAATAPAPGAAPAGPAPALVAEAPPDSQVEAGVRDLETHANESRDRHERLGKTLDRVQGVLDDPSVSTESKLELVDRFEEEAGDYPDLTERAQGLRDTLQAGGHAHLRTDWVTASFVVAPMFFVGDNGSTQLYGAQVEGIRSRWRIFQLSYAWAAIGTGVDDGPSAIDAEIFGGIGFLGLGAKLPLTPSGASEIGVLSYPLSMVLVSGRRPAENLISNDMTTFAFVSTSLYFATRFSDIKLETGFRVPLFWTTSYDEGTSPGAYSKVFPGFFYLGGGF